MLSSRPFPVISETCVLTLLENELTVRIPDLPSIRRVLNQSRSSVFSFALSTWSDDPNESVHKGVHGVKDSIRNGSHDSAEALPEEHHLTLTSHELHQTGIQNQVLGSPLHIPSRRQSHVSTVDESELTSIHPRNLHNLCGQARDVASHCEVCAVGCLLSTSDAADD